MYFITFFVLKYYSRYFQKCLFEYVFWYFLNTVFILLFKSFFRQIFWKIKIIIYIFLFSTSPIRLLRSSEGTHSINYYQTMCLNDINNRTNNMYVNPLKNRFLNYSNTFQSIWKIFEYVLRIKKKSILVTRLSIFT